MTVTSYRLLLTKISNLTSAGKRSHWGQNLEGWGYSIELRVTISNHFYMLYRPCPLKLLLLGHREAAYGPNPMVLLLRQPSSVRAENTNDRRRSHIGTGHLCPQNKAHSLRPTSQQSAHSPLCNQPSEPSKYQRTHL